MVRLWMFVLNKIYYIVAFSREKAIKKSPETGALYIYDDHSAGVAPPLHHRETRQALASEVPASAQRGLRR